MQTKEQWKRPKDWKVVAAVAAASALGLSSLAMAGPDEDGTTQRGIELDDRVPLTQVTSPTTIPTTVDEARNLVVESADLDSPFDDDTTSPTVGGDTQSVQSPQDRQSADSPERPSTTTTTMADDSPESPASPDTVADDSPESPASPQPEPESPQSPDSPASPQPEPESPQSPDSPDSPQPDPESPDSPDGSADSGDDGSADS